MSSQLVECVPNFSEGRDAAIIDQIAEAIESVEGVKLLNVDPGKATNRTVYTFVGAPEPVCEAAFRAAKRAGELIDMRQHQGEHPRFGALDVCPLIPISGISMAETAEYARRLGQRMGDELGMSIYLYENAASTEERRNLATIRAGEYEGLERKLVDPHWKPDFGPATFNAKLGATAVGARDFLIAYNVNLNTTSTRRANAIAFDIREKGRQAREGDPITGKPLLDGDGNPIWIPGSLKAVKAIGWFIDEYGIAQISINLTNLNETSIHECFEECVRKADARGIRVTGSEIVGLVPLAALLDAGRYFLLKQERSTGVSDSELIKIAVRSMGLDELAPFDPNERIIEYAIRDRSKKRLIDLSLQAFVEETASESPAPGGGSVAATLGALGAALATMVANLSSHKRGWDERWKEFGDWADKGKVCHDELLRLVDADTDAFNGIMAAFGLPKSTDEEKARRKQAIADATREAINIPLRVMEVSLAAMGPIRAMAETGNPNSVSDAGVGALCARSAVLGAYLNVKINCAGFGDAEFVAKTLEQAQVIASQAESDEKQILAIVESRM